MDYLHKVGLIFRDDRNKWTQPYVSSKTTHFIQTRHMHLSQFLTDCLQTFTKWVLIFWDDPNKGSQPYVSSKTAHFHQYLSQFLMDCLQTFTK